MGNVQRSTCLVETLLRRKRCPLSMNRNNDVRIKPALTPGEREKGFPRPGKIQALGLQWLRVSVHCKPGFFGVS